MNKHFITAATIGLLFAACGEATEKVNTGTRTNPLDSVSTLPFEAPDFARLTNADLRPAILRGMAEQLQEIKAITDNTAPATFENTIVAKERSGALLGRATRVFHCLVSSVTDDSLQALNMELAPKLAAHRDAINMDPAFFARVKAVHDAPGERTPAELRLIQRYYNELVRSGALLSEADKERLKKLNEEESNLVTKFSDNVLKAVAASAIVVDRRDQLDGLDEESIAAAATAAKDKGMEGKWVIALLNTTTQPVLAQLKDRSLRERIYKASVARNKGGEFDNRGIILRQSQLRAEKAALLGYPSWAGFVMADQMAGTPEKAVALLHGMAPAAARNAKAEAAKLQALIDKENGGFKLQPWDWDLYAEKVRKAEYDLDEAAIKPYLELESVLQNGVFHAANALYGMGFRERKDLPVYHSDVRVFDILDAQGEVFGLCYFDLYARENKQGGAWMSSFVDQNSLMHQQPVITQTCNYMKPASGQPCLLSWDEVTTLFHEFGHGLHGLLSQQVYPYFSGTATSTDFVEFPSQFNENWASEPTVFAKYAKHFSTGEAMPADLVARLRKSSKFNQGYATSEYLAAALLDIEWHSLTTGSPKVEDVEAFEQSALKKYGLDLAQVPPRYKSCYFSHIWGGGYSANYYAYMWSEVLEADAFDWFNAHGGMTAANGERMRATVLSKGGSEDGQVMFRALTGRDPQVVPLLRKRGLE